MPVPIAAIRPKAAASTLLVLDTFTRADSTSVLGTGETGTAYTASNTWGIASNQAYCVTDGTGAAYVTPTVADLDITITASGTLNHATDYRIPALLFKLNGMTEYLRLMSQSGHWYIKKTDGGVSNLLDVAQAAADGTAYTMRVHCQGNVITAFIDGVQIGQVTLSGGDTKYANYTKCGMYLSKNGSPATAARFDNFTVLRV